MKETVLITGATSGIGKEFAKIFANNKYRLILTGRNKKKLKEFKEQLSNENGIEIFYYACNLADEKQCLELYEFTKENNLEISILINNAGAGYNGQFDSIEWTKHKEIIDLNISGLTYITYLFLKDMKLSNKGKILNVASTGAYQPGPFINVYYATKAYVLSFSQALRQELKGSCITVTTLCPGATKTEFSKRSGKGDLDVAMSPQRVANAGYKDLMKNKSLSIPGAMNKVLVVLSKIAPSSVNAKMVKKIQKKAISKR